MIWLQLINMCLTGLVDCLIKEKMIKRNVGIGEKWLSWGDVPKFFQDYIPGTGFRIRYADVINAIFVVLSGLIFKYLYGYDFVQGAGAQIILLFTNWEHIFYQWWAGIFVKKKRLFDLENLPLWMESVPWNKRLARYHDEEKVTSEEILVIGIFGLVLLSIINVSYPSLKGLFYG